MVNQPSQALIASENGHKQPSNRRITQDKCDQQTAEVDHIFSQQFLTPFLDEINPILTYFKTFMFL